MTHDFAPDPFRLTRLCRRASEFIGYAVGLGFVGLLGAHAFFGFLTP